MSADGGAVPTLRLDKFLWFARLARTRSAVARLCTEGRVAISGVLVFKPHHAVRIGDWITIEQGHWRRRIRVTALGGRRNGAPMARLLYFEPEPPQPIPQEPWVSLIEEAAGAGHEGDSETQPSGADLNRPEDSGAHLAPIGYSVSGGRG